MISTDKSALKISSKLQRFGRCFKRESSLHLLLLLSLLSRDQLIARLLNQWGTQITANHRRDTQTTVMSDQIVEGH